MRVVGRLSDPVEGLRLALLALLLLLAVWLAVQIAWRFSAAPNIAVELEPTALQRSSAQALPIGRWHLFGRELQPLELQPAEPTRETELRLTLKGSFSDPSTDRGFAIIAGADDREQVYRVGDELPGGARLERIQRDRVVLRREGVLETLSLPELRATPPAHSAPAAARPGVLTQAPLGGGRLGGIGAPGTLGTQEWQAVREQHVRDPAALAREVSIVPHVDGRTGRLAGVRLNPHADATLLQQAGLRSTDVITAVNGIPVDDLARGRELLQQLERAERLRLTLLRDGSEQTLDIDLRR